MNKKFSMIAILVSLSASLAFAGENKKSTASAGDAQPAATAAASPNEQNPCVAGDSKTKAKTRGHQAPTDQEKEFDHLLMGIYG